MSLADQAAYQMVAHNIVHRRRLIHVLADHVVCAEDCDIVFPPRSLFAVLLADNPHTRINQSRIVYLLRLAHNQILDAIHRLQFGLKVDPVVTHFPRAPVILRLIPKETILAGMVEKRRFADDRVH